MFILISACRNTSSDNFRTASLRRLLKRHGFSFKQVEGIYQGQREVTFQVFTNEVNFLKNIANHFNQDAILVVDNQLRANVIDLKGNGGGYVGRWTLTDQVAEYCTRIGKQFFICK